MLGDNCSATAPVVNDHRAGGGQGGAGRPVVVAAQQQINRVRARRGGRDEDPHHRPGGAAAGPITQIVRPGPGSPVFGGRSGRLAAGGTSRPSRPCGAETSSSSSQHQRPASCLTRGLALVQHGTLGPKHPGRPSCHRGWNAPADSGGRWQMTMIPGENQTTADSGAGIEIVSMTEGTRTPGVSTTATAGDQII
jgi:hypothetical protein